MGQAVTVATAFTAIMLIVGLSTIVLTSISVFDTLNAAITETTERQEIILNEEIEVSRFVKDNSANLRLNVTNTGETRILIRDFVKMDLIATYITEGGISVDEVDNNTSDVDGSADKGTHSDFTAQQSGPDSVYDTLTESLEQWLAGWDQRVKLTIDHNDVDSSLSEFPVMIHLSTSSGRNSDDVSFVFDELQNDANRLKIAVTTSDGTSQCYVEIEEWDDANEEAWLWVKAPSVDSTIDTDLYLYYDVDHADNTVYVGDPNSAPAEAVWDDDFRLVTHMRDDPDTSHIRDSTYLDNDGTKRAAGEPAVTTSGNVSDAQSFDGGNDYVDLGSDSSLDLRSTDFTIEAWIYPTTQSTRWPTIYDVGNWELSLGIGQDTNTDKLEVWVDDATSYASDSDVTYNAWNYVVLSWNGSNYNFYIDGAADGSPSGSAYPDTGTTYIGGIGQGDSYFAGTIDEVRASNTSRTSSWVKASFESGKDDLVDFGGEEYETYQLDLEVQWTDTPSLVQDAELAVYAGSFSGSEDLTIECWKSGSSQWVNLGNLTANSWNNYTVTSYLTSTTFTVRFKGSNETIDSTQDTWQIDASLLRLRMGSTNTRWVEYDPDETLPKYWMINRVFFHGTQGDVVNPIDLQSLYGLWDPDECLEILVHLDDSLGFECVTIGTPNGVKASHSLTLDEQWGTVTLPQTEKTVWVQHDLGRPPDNIQVTATLEPDTYWVSTWNSTHFLLEMQSGKPYDILFFWQVN